MPAADKKLGVFPAFSQSDVYLVPSHIAEDRKQKIGRLPHEISGPDLRELGGPETPLKAIRAKCLDCSGANAAEVRKCVAMRCALWPFRMGHNPFWGKSETEEPISEAAE